MVLRLFLSSIFILFVSTLFAQTSAPKYSNEFLSIGVGARALAMSNATVASVNDVTAAYWNPAGLSLINNDVEIGLMHSEYFAGIAKYDYGGACFNLNNQSKFGLSLIRFGVDDIPNTLELIDNDGNIRYDRIKSFSVADYAFLFSYAKKSNIEGLRYGGNVKIIRRTAGDFASAWGFGLDVAAQYDYKKWHFGALGRDITSTFNAWNFNTSELEDVFILTGNEIPQNSLEITLPKLILGVARDFKISNKFAALAEIDFDFTFDGKRNVMVKSDFSSIDPHFGFEISYNKVIYFRGGAGNFQKIPDHDGKEEFSFQPNLGLGIRINRLSIDYALTDIGDQSIALYSNVFTLRFAINKAGSTSSTPSSTLFK